MEYDESKNEFQSERKGFQNRPTRWCDDEKLWNRELAFRFRKLRHFLKVTLIIFKKMYLIQTCTYTKTLIRETLGAGYDEGYHPYRRRTDNKNDDEDEDQDGDENVDEDADDGDDDEKDTMDDGPFDDDLELSGVISGSLPDTNYEQLDDTLTLFRVIESESEQH